MDYSAITPLQARKMFRENDFCVPTSGFCHGFVQCNLIILPSELADDFKIFAEKNKAACPVLEISRPGERGLEFLCKDVDLAKDFPKYRVYVDGELHSEPLSIENIWRNDFVSFLIGCSFSFEEALKTNGIPIRHNEMGCNVPMYITNIDCEPHGIFKGKMVVSMRPVKKEMISAAYEVTGKMPKVHGAPIHHGDGRLIGINDINKPDFGNPVIIYNGEEPVFWPCGVTPQSVVMNIRPELAITHAPGHMLICDIANEELTR